MCGFYWATLYMTVYLRRWGLCIGYQLRQPKRTKISSTKFAEVSIHICSSDSLATFKSRLKSHLFSSAYHIYTVGHKKRAPKFLPITLADFDKIYTAVTATKFLTKCYHLHTYFFKQRVNNDVINTTLTSCNSVLSPCGVNWNSALWMTPLINGDVVC